MSVALSARTGAAFVVACAMMPTVLVAQTPTVTEVSPTGQAAPVRHPQTVPTRPKPNRRKRRQGATKRRRSFGKPFLTAWTTHPVDTSAGGATADKAVLYLGANNALTSLDGAGAPNGRRLSGRRRPSPFLTIFAFTSEPTGARFML